MISFDGCTKTFLLSGKNYSYCMYINRAGLLQHLYWGKKIGAADAVFLVAAHGLPASPNPDDYNKDMGECYGFNLLCKTNRVRFRDRKEIFVIIQQEPRPLRTRLLLNGNRNLKFVYC